MTQDQQLRLADQMLELMLHLRRLAETEEADPLGDAHTLLLALHCVEAAGATVHYGHRGAIAQAVENGNLDAVRVIVSAPALEVES